MARSTARVTRALIAAGGIALVCASTATAATFKNDSGTLAAAKKTGVTASGGSLKFTGKANPTGSTKFAGQIDFDSGKATGLSAPGTLTLTHSGHKATLKVKKISGTTLTTSLNGNSLSFPLSLSNATSKPNSGFTGVKVSGVVVKLSSADATALNNALKTKAYKSGAKFGTLSYNGIDRELIEDSSGGPLTLCNDKNFDTKNFLNGVTPSPISPATLTASPCNGTNDDTHGIDFPEAGKILGFVDTATGNGRVTVKGGIQDQKTGRPTGQFKSVIFDLLGANSDLRATVFVNGVPSGQTTVATIGFLAEPTLTITKSGGSLSVPADGTSIALTKATADNLNTLFCNGSTCNGGTYSQGDVIGYAGGTTDFK